MEKMQQITIEEWMRWKEDIREKLRETAENFVYIGYRLKQIRDSGMYGGSADIFEFARIEYGLGKSTVSRFIAINEKFSEGGNSTELREPYRMIGSSKLAEMLTLTDEECSMITEKATVAQIRELKNFSRQEPDAGEEEEREDGWQKTLTPLQKGIVEYFRGKKELLEEVLGYVEEGDYKGASESLSPNSSTTFKKGILFLFMYDYRTGVKYKVFGNEDIVEMSWEEFLAMIWETYRPYSNMEESCYDAFYGRSEEEGSKVEETLERRNEEESVATSQREEETGEDDVEEMEDEDEMEDGDEEDDEEAGEPANPAEPENDEDGSGRVERMEISSSKKYEKEVRDLIKNAEYRSKRIAERLRGRGKRELDEYRDIRRAVKRLDTDLEQLIRFIDLQEEEG